MATRTRTRNGQSAVPLSNLSPNNHAAPSQTIAGSSIRVPTNTSPSSQSGATTPIQGTSSSQAGSSSTGITGNTGNAGNARSTAVSGASPASATRPGLKFWDWMQNVGGVLGILGFFAAIIYFIFPYQASLIANKLATSSNAMSNIANDWTRWAQCTSPGSKIANATWCRDHPTPDTFDSGFNMARRSINPMMLGLSHWKSIVVTLIALIIGIWIVAIIYRTARGPKLSPDQLDQLLNTTNFNKEELNAWYKGFLKDCPSGVLGKEEFTAVYRIFFPGGNPSSFAEHVFRVFDSDKSGSIDFREFISALSVTSRGKIDDKIEWAFRLYDIDGDGKISFDEMLVIVRAIYEMVGSMVELPEDEDTPEKRAEKIFRMMDRDHSGSLDIEDFTEGSKRDETIVSALRLYDGLV